MSSDNDFDVIILGAGISGLAIASELSKSLKVLILEKENQISLKKYWLTNKLSLSKNLELEPFIDKYYSSLDIVAFDRTYRRVKGEYILWDSKKLLKHYYSTLLENNAIVSFNTKFYSYKYLPNKITVFANNKTYSSKLIIDCMGYSSPLIQSHSIVNIHGYYLLYGGLVKLRKSIQPIAFDNMIIDKNPKYLEVFPNSEGYAYVVLISPVKSALDTKSIQDELSFILSSSHYSDYFEGSFERKLEGIVPVGFLKRNSFERIYFYGEAGQLNPSTTGTSFTRILYSYKQLAKSLDKLVKNNTLSQKDLSEIDITFLSKYNRRFQLYLFQELLKWNSLQFKNALITASKLSDSEINDILFGEFRPIKSITANNIIQFLKDKNIPFLKLFLKALF